MGSTLVLGILDSLSIILCFIYYCSAIVYLGHRLEMTLFEVTYISLRSASYFNHHVFGRDMEPLLGLPDFILHTYYLIR